MEYSKTINENLVFILDKQDFILESKKSGSDDYVLEGIAAVFQKENNNNRIYMAEDYLPHLNYLKDKIKQKRLLGELDHPEKFDVSLKNISHIIEDLNYDKNNNTIRIKVRLLDTPAGQIAKKLVDAGVPISISSRAAGNVGPDKRVEIKKIFTYDLVADPGFQNAQLERVYEGAGFTETDIRKITGKDSVISDLICINESLGLENNSSTKIYKVENNDEFDKLINNTEKNKKTLMEKNNEFVTADELNQYSIFLKKEMDTMKSAIETVKEQKVSLDESEVKEDVSGYCRILEERIQKLEKYSDYLAENLENSVKYGEYLAENLDNSISYSKYLAENLDKSISYSKYLAENVDKGISYTEYVAENVDNSIEYSKYLAEKLDQSVQYSEYLAESVEKNINYSEYLAENIDDGIQYSEYIAENLDKGISYAEYVGENLERGISYTEYVAENLSKSISYSEYLAESLNKNIDSTEKLNEKVSRNISYTEYIAESLNDEFGNKDQAQALKESIEYSGRLSSETSGFAGNYDDLESKIDNLIAKVQTQKTEINEAAKTAYNAETQKATTLLTESLNDDKVFNTGMKFIDEMPAEYVQVWESLNEGHKQSIVAQSNFYKLDTPYQIRNFWSTRQLGVSPIGLQKLDESENTSDNGNQAQNPGYSNAYMDMIARSLESRFQTNR